MQILEQVYNGFKSEINNDNHVTGIPSGYRELDNATSGFQNGQLTIVAARPGMGKLAFTLNIANNLVTKTNKRVAIFSLDQLAKQLAKNILVIHSGKHKFSLQDISEIIVKSPIYFEDPVTISILELMERCLLYTSPSPRD